MARLSIYLLGPLHVTLGGQAIINFGYDKVRALLSYLVMEADRPLRREALAGLLWPEQPQAAAFRSLRQALSNLRQAIGDYTATPPYLLILRDSVQFNLQSDYYLDVSEFSTLSETIKAHRHRRLETCQSCAQWRARAVSIYRGDFLAQFSIGDSLAFEEWSLVHRERLRNQVLEILYRLANFHERRGEYDQTRHYALRQIETDPLKENAYHQMMTALALDGQRTAALAQYEAFRNLLEEELGVEPEEETERLHQLIRSGTLKVEHLGLMAACARLPAPPSPFLGREEEMMEIASLLEDPNCRLITLVGLGGVGKTSLAIKVAAQYANLFTHGACFVPLAPLSSPEGLFSAIATSMNFSFAGSLDHKTQLLNYLSKMELLLILDNFEHLLPEGALLVTEILQYAPQLVILITTNERLNVRSEYIHTLEGLLYPGDEDDGKIESYSAVALFLQHARRYEITLDREDLPRVKRICQLVEGIPLAIELAASMLRSLSCSEIVQEIEKSIDSLAVAGRDVPERQRSLRAVFDYSWTFLSENERSIFRRLSVFRGGIQRAAAEQVSGTSLLALTALIDKSLLYKDQEGRYEIHRLLCQYAFEKLEQAGEVEQIYRRHLEFFLQYAQEAAQQLNQAEQTAWLKRLDQERGNLQAAFQIACSFETAGAESALRLAGALGRFWLLRGYLLDGQSWLNQAIDLGEKASAVPLEVKVRAFYWAGVLAGYLGDNLRAAQLAESGLSLTRKQGESLQSQALMSTLMGDVKRNQGDYDQAKALYEESLELFRKLDDKWGIQLSLNNLFRIAYRQNEFGRACNVAEESLALAQETGDQWNIALTLDYLGIIAHDRGQYERGTQFLNQSLAISRSLGARFMIANANYWLGRVARSQGDEALAISHFEESLALFKETGTRWGMSVSLQGLGVVALDEGDLHRAKTLLDESLAIQEAVGDRQLIAYIKNSLGDVAQALGEYEQANILYKDSLSILRVIGDELIIANSINGIASIAISQGKLERATRLLGAEEAIREGIGAPKSPVEQKDHQRNVNLLFGQLPEPQFRAIWNEGRTMVEEDLTRVIDYAMQEFGQPM